MTDQDDVLTEIWRVKADLSAKHDGDLDAIFRELKICEMKHPDRLVDRQPKPAETIPDEATKAA